MRRSAKQQGIEQGKIDVARWVLARGSSVEDMADITGISIEEVCKLQN